MFNLIVYMSKSVQFRHSQYYTASQLKLVFTLKSDIFYL